MKPENLFIIIALLLFGLAGSFYIYDYSYKKELAAIDKAKINQEQNWIQEINKETDAYKLTQTGLRLANIDSINLSLAYLEQATSLKKNYRDGWIALALVQIKANNLKGALTSAKNAEKLDPIIPKTYEVLKSIYDTTKQKDLAKQAQEKYNYLVNSE